MRSFAEIYAIAAERKGGEDALEEQLDRQNPGSRPVSVADNRWLSGMTKCVFQAGFNWRVVENMWPGFEEAFEGFDPGRCAMLNDDDLARLVTDSRIVRHGPKICAVQRNAVFLMALAKDYGSAGEAFGNWPSAEYVDLLTLLKKRGSRLGGNTGQYFLRFMGVDGFILSRDVVARLVAEKIIDKAPSSQKAMAAVQQACNTWRAESNRSLSEISRVLAKSIG